VKPKFQASQDWSRNVKREHNQDQFGKRLIIGGPKYAGLSGIIYMLTGVAMGMNGTIMGRRRRRMARHLTALGE
jgi:hypothetical protein